MAPSWDCRCCYHLGNCSEQMTSVVVVEHSRRKHPVFSWPKSIHCTSVNKYICLLWAPRSSSAHCKHQRDAQDEIEFRSLSSFRFLILCDRKPKEIEELMAYQWIRSRYFCTIAVYWSVAASSFVGWARWQCLRVAFSGKRTYRIGNLAVVPSMLKSSFSTLSSVVRVVSRKENHSKWQVAELVCIGLGASMLSQSFYRVRDKLVRASSKFCFALRFPRFTSRRCTILLRHLGDKLDGNRRSPRQSSDKG